MEGAAHQFGDAFGLLDLRDPFGDAAEHGAVVDLLERLAAGRLAADLPDDQDHRGRVLEGGVDADRGMGGAGAAGDEADTGLAGQLAIGFGHVGGAGLVPAH